MKTDRERSTAQSLVVVAPPAYYIISQSKIIIFQWIIFNADYIIFNGRTVFLPSLY